MSIYEKTLIAIIIMCSIYFKLTIPLSLGIICLTIYSISSNYLTIQSKKEFISEEIGSLKNSLKAIESKVSHLSNKDVMKDVTGIGGIRK